MGQREVKVAVVHPGLNFGGSEAPAQWTLEALKQDYDALIAANEAEAGEKNDAVLTREAEQQKPRDHLQRGANSFSVKTFVETMRRVVAEFVKQHVAAG